MAAPRRRHSSPTPSSSSSSPSPHRRKSTRSDRPASSPAARRDSRVSSHRDRDRDRHRRYSSNSDSDSDRYNSNRPRRADRSSDDARRRELALPPPPPLPPPRRPDPRVSPPRDRRLGSDTDSEARERGRAKDARDEPRRRSRRSSDDGPVPGASAGRKSRAVRSHSSDNGNSSDSGDAEDGARKREFLPPPPPLPPRPDARVSPGRDRRRGSGKITGSGSGDMIGTADDGPKRRERSKLKQDRDSHRREGYATSDDDDGDRDRQTGRSHGSASDAKKRDREGRNGGQGTKVKDTRKEETLPPMPPMPSLPPPPPLLNARAGRDSRVGEERRYPRREERRSPGEDSDSEGGERGRGLREERGKRRRYSDESSADEDRRRDDRHRKTAGNRRSDNDSSRNGVRDVDGAKDMRKEEYLPPPPPLPSLPPPPPLPTASTVRDSRVVLGNERRNGYGERRRDGRISSDDDSDSEGRVRGKRSKEERRKRDSSGEDSDSEGHVRRRRSKEERRKRHNSDTDSDSESPGRRKRPRESRKHQRHRHSDGSSEDDDRRRDKRDRKRERNRRSDEDNGERGQRNGRHNSPRRRKQDRDSRNGDQDPRKREPSPPPLPPMPDALAGRTGGIYIPPFKLARMMREVEDKSSEAYQRLSWDALRKSINGLVNKVNATNIKNIIPELLSENLIRGRGLFCRSCMKSQMASPGFTDVFAALVAVVNTKFPDLGKLLLKRIVLQLKRAYKRNDKPQLLAATKFIAHLVNQQVAHEIIALELLTLLLENPTDDSVEVAVGFVKECGAVLQDLSPKGLYGIFERFRGILHEAELDKRVRYLIEDLFGIRKAKFEGYPAVRPELDLVELEDQCIHEISLEDDDADPETNLDVFKPNPQFLDDEKAYENLKRSMLGDEPSEEDGSDEAPEDEDEELSEEDEEEKQEIKDETETNLVNLRRTIYLTIMSSVDFEEAGHKLLKIKLEPGQEMELCIMLLECCSQERTYLRYYGLLGQRFCMINRVHQENFETCFVQQYSMIHRLETNKLRNVAKFFAHLLGTSALPWHVLSYIRLTEEDTTSSSRIFIKILFQELSEHLGIRLLNERLNDPTMQDSFESIFPKDNPKNTRFSINFFTSIGLGGITENLREYLKNMPRLIMQQQKPVSDSDESGSSGSSTSDDTSSGSESDSDSDSSSDESERRRRKRRRR